MTTLSSSSGSSRVKWITIILIVLLLAAAAFAGWAYFRTRDKTPTSSVNGITAKTSLPEPVQFHCPLDGTPVENYEATTKRPLVVQIDNAPAARNQSGLSQADMVYEAMAEGDVTRFSAVFDCREVDTVGPVRSARLIDAELVPEYQALLVDSGASQGTAAVLDPDPYTPRISDVNHSEAFWRVDDRAAPHNLMTSTGNIRQAAAAAGQPGTANLAPLVFKDDTPAPSISSITVPYSAIALTSYQYDAGTNSWLRSISGEPHIDTLTGKQIASKNVIIQYVSVTTSDIEEDVGGNMGLIFGLTGKGRAIIFRDGQAIPATWLRGSSGEVTTYVDATGNPIPLNRGLTFVQLVPLDFQANWG